VTVPAQPASVVTGAPAAVYRWTTYPGAGVPADIDVAGHETVMLWPLTSAKGEPDCGSDWDSAPPGPPPDPEYSTSSTRPSPTCVKSVLATQAITTPETANEAVSARQSGGPTTAALEAARQARCDRALELTSAETTRL